MLQQERQLIIGLAAGEERACRDFVMTWHPRIIGWVRSESPPYLVEDYAQDVWQHLMDDGWRRLLRWRPLDHDVEWHPHSLEAFLKEVTRNRVRDLLRAESRQLPGDPDPSEIIDEDSDVGRNPWLEAERSRLRRAFRACSRRFSPRDHLLIDMWWAGHQAAEIAKAIGSNANNVHARKHHLIKILRDCLVEKLPEYFRRV